LTNENPKAKQYGKWEKAFLLQGQIKGQIKNSKANLNGKWKSLMSPKWQLGIKVFSRP
jgi:hypothetical protein